MPPWRLLDTGVRSAAANMALDHAILKARDNGSVPNTLRFLQFSPPAALVGYHQSVGQEIREDFCHARDIHINRRLTGGGTIFFDHSQLGWELIASKEELGLKRILFPFFQKICQAAIEGLRELGVEANYRFKNDIEVKGRKISGTGGVEEGEAFLFQGTLLMDFDVESMLYALRVPTEKLVAREIDSARDRVTSLKRELGYLPDLDKVKQALAMGFSKVFGVEFLAGGLTPVEDELFTEHLGYYESREWVYPQGYQADRQMLLHSTYNAPGGLIRTAVAYDEVGERINSVLITGDFFAFPARAILDLEIYLKGIAVARLGDRMEKFFKKTGYQVPGVSAADFVAAINKTLVKARYTKMGMLPEEANAIFTINADLADIKGFDFLLIPYCSKPTDCDFRYCKGCDQCGGCHVGELYGSALSHGLEPITVQNFEDLMSTLKRLESNGAKSYLGSCCEAFFIKHEEDFKSVKLPGILVDINSSTCYDLGLEREAKRGTFENQTRLKTDLISKLLDITPTVGADPS